MQSKKSIPRHLSFSESQGYESIPTQLDLEQLPVRTRTRLWNVLYESLQIHPIYRTMDEHWLCILFDIHCNYFALPADEWNSNPSPIINQYRNFFKVARFNKVFDLLIVLMRDSRCPKEFTTRVAALFDEEQLAYTVVMHPEVTIMPTATVQEGRVIGTALRDTSLFGLNGANSHLRLAGQAVNDRNWAESIRNSISAVESVARQIDPNASRSLQAALNSIKKSQRLHPALGDAFQKLYGYTSDEQGVRHALLDESSARVDSAEAIFMLGACAAFVSYLCRTCEQEIAHNTKQKGRDRK